MDIAEFVRLLATKGDELYRDMPWRADTRAYYVLVSELMLQQTQVGRVVPKFEAFVARFPDERALAEASLAEVLALWQGLGYNRRARYLHEAARMVVCDYGGEMPSTETALCRLPGVGAGTAGAIMAYAFNQPAVFVETNVRTVYLHHFFDDRNDVSDRELLELVAATIDADNPRRFYQNIMDYGTWLKARGVRNISRSRHYRKQSALRGSVRELRGEMVRRLVSGGRDEAEFAQGFADDARYTPALEGLVRDGLVVRDDGRVRLA